MFHLSAVLTLAAMALTGWFLYKKVRKVFRTSDITDVAEQAEYTKELAKKASEIDVEQYEKDRQTIEAVKGLNK